MKGISYNHARYSLDGLENLHYYLLIAPQTTSPIIRTSLTLIPLSNTQRKKAFKSKMAHNNCIDAIDKNSPIHIHKYHVQGILWWNAIY